MTSLDKLKRTSLLARWMVFTVLGVVISVAVFGFITEGQWWVSFGDEQFNLLWQSRPNERNLLLLAVAPAALVLIVGIFFLQKLLQQFALGAFYSSTSMRCLKWIAWLVFFGVLYDMMLNAFASLLIAHDTNIDISIRPLTLIILLCLPVLVHLFSAAREIDQENKEII